MLISTSQLSIHHPSIQKVKMVRNIRMSYQRSPSIIKRSHKTLQAGTFRGNWIPCRKTKGRGSTYIEERECEITIEWGSEEKKFAIQREGIRFWRWLLKTTLIVAERHKIDEREEKCSLMLVTKEEKQKLFKERGECGCKRQQSMPRRFYVNRSINLYASCPCHLDIDPNVVAPTYRKNGLL